MIRKLSFVEMNHALCWLGLASNRLARLAHLQNLSSLAVLDVSNNRIARLDGLAGLSSLKALIATRNRITYIHGLTPTTHPALETLVLSHNLLKECSLAGFPSLKKLSVAHNDLHAFPQLSRLPALAELRLSGNKMTSVSKSVASLPRLGILDIGSNLITQPQGFEPLRGLLWLKSLTIQGNGAVSTEATEVQELLASLPRLEIVNNRRQAGKSQKKRHRTGSSRTGSTEARAGPGPRGPGPAPKAVAVHGRAFSGRRAVFSESDEEQPKAAEAVEGKKGKRKRMKGAPKQGTGSESKPATEARRSKVKRKRVLSRGAEVVVAEQTVQDLGSAAQSPLKKRAASTCGKRRKTQG